MDRSYTPLATQMASQGPDYSSSVPVESEGRAGPAGDELATTAVEHMTGAGTKAHKPLPHLMGRRMYQAESTEPESKRSVEAADERSGHAHPFQKQSPQATQQTTQQTTPGGTLDNLTIVGPGQTRTGAGAGTGSGSGSGTGGGLDLEAVPRPQPQKIENTVMGISYTTKFQAGNATAAPSSIIRHTSVDEGSSIPRLFRCTLQTILTDGTDIFGNASFPFAGVAQPFAELGECEAPVPLSPHGDEDILRCTRCGAYANPGFGFLEGGNKFKCNICEVVSPVPSGYFAHGGIDSAQDKADKPEINFGTCEFVAPAGLAGKQVSGNNLFLLIECTANAINSGKAVPHVARTTSTGGSISEGLVGLHSRPRTHEHWHRDI
jgi:hypothetical protein